MLQRIVLSKDRKYGRVYFDTHSIGVHSSEGKVWELIYEIVIEPGIRAKQIERENEERFLASLEITKDVITSDKKSA